MVAACSPCQVELTQKSKGFSAAICVLFNREHADKDWPTDCRLHFAGILYCAACVSNILIMVFMHGSMTMVSASLPQSQLTPTMSTQVLRNGLSLMFHPQRILEYCMSPCWYIRCSAETIARATNTRNWCVSNWMRLVAKIPSQLRRCFGFLAYDSTLWQFVWIFNIT